MFEDPSKDRTVRLVRTGEIADTHQEFANDLPAGEPKGLAKELDPRLRRARVVGSKPKSKTSHVFAAMPAGGGHSR